MRLSVVTTMYQSSSYLREFYERTIKVLEKMSVPFEMVFVDDGSPDDSLLMARRFLKGKHPVKIVALSRNFGHFRAILTGLSYAEGDFVFLIDCDLEERPEMLPDLYEKMRRGSPDHPIDVVYALQDRRKGGWIEKTAGALFYRLFNWIAQVQIPPNWMMARLMTRRYVQSLLLHEERETFLGGLMCLTGFRQEGVVAHKSSKGKTAYSMAKKIAMMVDGVTSFSSAPLIFIFLFGMAISSIALIGGLALFITRVFLDIEYKFGWSSILLAICFFGGATLASIGVIGIYLGKIFIEVKKRPCIVQDVFSNAQKKPSGRRQGTLVWNGK